MVKTPVKLPITECMMCEEVVEFVGQKVNEKRIIIEIISLTIHKVCQMIPSVEQRSQVCYLINEISAILT